MSKPIRRRVLALLLGLLVMALVGELLLSRVEAFRPYPRHVPGEIADDTTRSAFLQPDPVVGWSMRPNDEYRHQNEEFDVLYRSNQLGFRSEREFDETLPEGRILLAGDSFTFGIGVEYAETYGALLEERTGMTVCNVAMPGFAVDQMWLQVKRGLDLIEPDLVVVGVCDADLARSQTAYSLGDHLGKPTFKLEDGRLEPMTSADRMNPIGRFFEHHSRIWMVMRQGMRFVGYKRPWGEWWKLNEAILEELRTTCESAGVPLILVYIPTPERRAFPVLASYAERVGLEYVDLTQGMPPEGMYFPIDRHLTVAGNAFAAERVAAAALKKK